MIEKMRKNISIIILAVVFCLITVGCSSGGKENTGDVDKAHTYTWWMPQGEDSSYYSDYRDNPAVDYMLSRNYKGINDKDTKIDIEFNIPASGSARDNLTTIISTGDYTDVIDISMYTGSVVELYENGIAQDITSYVEKYMPNYLKFLKENPDFAKTATNVVDGEKKYLQLYSYETQLADQWGGYDYRRDWIVKYGTNPKDGSSFSGQYTKTKEDGTVDMESWEDNVIFPSGGANPIYISDWEWMLGIFQTALQKEGITDGYPMSLYYPGYVSTGELVCAFGGGGAHWYQDKEGNAQFGLTSDNFRAYLQCMNTWYKNGWIDTAFPEHASDMFYQVDDAKVRSGKVGLWYGVASQLIGRCDLGEGLTKGMVVYAARQPINDKYGSEAQKNVEPYTFFQSNREGSPIIVTDLATEKDIEALFSFLDYTFSDEGILMKSWGLNKEQYEAIQNEFYTKNGLTNGSYTVTEIADGTKELEDVDVIKSSANLNFLDSSNRLFGLGGVPKGYLKVNHTEGVEYRKNVNEYAAYTNTGRFLNSFISQLTAKDNSIISKLDTNITEFGAKNIPAFIQGKKDPFNDQDWAAYLKAISKYTPEKGTAVYQQLLDQMK